LRKRNAVTEAKQRGTRQRTVEDFLSVTNAGLQAKVDGKQVLVGRQTFLQENGVTGLKAAMSFSSLSVVSNAL
jgi:cation transport ATPase